MNLRIPRTLTLAAACFCALGSPAAQGQDTWGGNFRLGYLATSGNTDSDNLDARLRLDYARGENWSFRAGAAAAGVREQDTTTAENYELDGRAAYEVTDQDFTFARLGWRKDRFSGYERQFSQTVGYGRRLLDTTAHRLDVELGAGARQARLADGTRENDPIVRGASDYRYALNDDTAVEVELSVEAGSDNTFSEATGAVNTSLLENIGLIFSYSVRHNSTVPVGRVRTDTRTSVSIEYRF